MAWRVERTESFDRWWSKEKIEASNYKFHEAALKEFKNVDLPYNQKCIFRNSSFECWVSRLADKLRKQGKSGGFRVIFVLDLEEGVLLLQGIFRRSHLHFEGQSGKYDEAYDELVKELARQFVDPKL